MKIQFMIAVIFLLIAILSNLLFVLIRPKSYKRGWKLAQMGIGLYLLGIYIWAGYSTTAPYLLRSGWLTVIGVSLLALLTALDTWTDMLKE